jgi:pimeloyl-ACP methyl ester carboxylesterase
MFATMWMPRVHTAVDELAMWTEDLHRRAPMPFRPARALPLDCFGPLPTPSGAPPRQGAWQAPSPRAFAGDPVLHVEATPARGTRLGTVILVPPWKLPRLSMLSGWTSGLAAAGHDVWTLIPPRHLGRAAGGGRSGEAFVSPDLPAVRAAMEQLVLELRVLVGWARTQPGRVALVGLSLGGLAAALAATAPERIDRLAAIAPPADLAAVAAGTRIGRRYLQLCARAGAPAPAAPELAEMLAPFLPAARAPTAGRVLVAVGDADRIALPPGALSLAQRWRATLRRYPRGHLTLLFACAAVRTDVQAFLGAE